VTALVVATTLSRARLAEPVAASRWTRRRRADASWAANQLCGHLRAATPTVPCFGDQKDAALRLDRGGGRLLRRSPRDRTADLGRLVRMEWSSAAGSDPRDIDRVEGVLQAVYDGAFTVRNPYAGTLNVPRDRLRKLQVIRAHESVVIEPAPPSATKSSIAT